MSVINNKKVSKRELNSDIDFISVVEDQAPELWNKDWKWEADENTWEWLVYFCKVCRNVLDMVEEWRARKWKKVVPICPNCKISVVRWSKMSVKNYFKIND